MRRATVGLLTHNGHPQYISIHALLAESDRHWQTGQSRTRQFLSTLSLRRATAIGRRGRAARGNFYPRSPCGERRCVMIHREAPVLISIHALLAESDQLKRAAHPRQKHFYPRSPCGERHCSFRQRHVLTCDFYPRSPCGERLFAMSSKFLYQKISIHALLAESDRRL